MNKKKKSNKSGYPDEAIKTLARCFYPSMVEFFNSEEVLSRVMRKFVCRLWLRMKSAGNRDVFQSRL